MTDYYIVVCPNCRGDMFDPATGLGCSECNATGRIDVYSHRRPPTDMLFVLWFTLAVAGGVAVVYGLLWLLDTLTR